MPHGSTETRFLNPLKMRDLLEAWLELDALAAENERLHARVSDLTARLAKCADLHRRSITPTANDAGGGRSPKIAARTPDGTFRLLRGGKVGKK